MKEHLMTKGLHEQRVEHLDLQQSHRRHGRGYPLCILGPHW